MKKLTLAAMAAAALALTGMAKAQTTLYGDHEITGNLQVDGNIKIGSVAGSGLDIDLGNYSFAFSFGSSGYGGGSAALGGYTSASGDYSAAVGGSAYAGGYYSTALGGNSYAMGDYSVATAPWGSAYGNYSVALGGYAAGEYSVAMGESQAYGNFSTAIGLDTIAYAYACTAIGAGNDPEGGDSYSWVSTDPLFIVGNGTISEPHNALVIYKNGRIKMDRQGDISMGEFGE